jgi:hypothetical protein
VEEEVVLANAHSIMGSTWSKIVNHLPGRTENHIKVRGPGARGEGGTNGHFLWWQVVDQPAPCTAQRSAGQQLLPLRFPLLLLHLASRWRDDDRQAIVFPPAGGEVQQQ